MDTALYTISLISALALLCVAFVSKVFGKFQFWPPPYKGSWQDISFIVMFRTMVYPLIAVTWLAFDPSGSIPLWVQLGVGGFLLFFGFGLAIASTLNLGWKNAFGDKKGLVTNGWFQYSRNPVYLVTFFGIAGWALLVMSLKITIVLLVWCLLYLLAVFEEERWLESTYGEEYLTYKERVPRFL